MALYLLLISWMSTIVPLNENPSFKGGSKSLNSFISRNLVYPEFSKRNCLQGTINVSFKLNRVGRITNSKVAKGYGLDLDKEALRIVRLTSGRWEVPAGFDTTQFIVIPINFNLKEFDCSERTADELKEAIADYRTWQNMTNAVINFYDKKSSGTYVREEESKIFEIKAQLGYNDRFFDQTVRQGRQKLKQGDVEGACEDFMFVHKLGSDKADKYLASNCRK